MNLRPEDVLTSRQLEALDAQEQGIGDRDAARQMNISVGGLKQRRTRARRLLIIAGLDPRWRKKS